MDAAAALKRARSDARLSQRELALRAGVPQPAVARIEQGRVRPRIDTLSHLLAACGQTLVTQRAQGQGIDRSVIRRLLRLSPRERLVLAATEAANVERLTRVQ
jgi:transcriptional regulator with XRE-family HTH domain